MEVLHGILTGRIKKSWLEQVQRRAVHFATKTYYIQDRKDVFTQALNHLNWPTSKHRRKVNRLTLINVQDTAWPCSNQYTTLCET